MRSLTNFVSEGNWYKGNLHCHTVISDGKLTAKELKEYYQKHDYHFMVYSDHNVHTFHQDLCEDNFLVIPGFEGNCNAPSGDHREFHFLLIEGTDEIKKAATKPMFNHMDKVPVIKFSEGIEGIQQIQAYIDEMVDRGYMVMFNHPAWSIIEYDDVIKLKNLFAIEVVNYCSAQLENMGESNVFWDAVLRKGMKVWGTAVDDNHNRHPLDTVFCDSCGGYVVVKSKDLTRQSISEALYNGSFYASCGPEIYDFRIEDDEIILECSPVSKVYCRGDSRQISLDLSPDESDSITSFRSKLRGSEKYVRIEIIDSKGRKAYTNPIFI